MIQLQDVLEALVDQHTLRTVVECLESICYEKAGHIEENWQDQNTAAPWMDAAQRLGNINIRLQI